MIVELIRSAYPSLLALAVMIVITLGGGALLMIGPPNRARFTASLMVTGLAVWLGVSSGTEKIARLEAKLPGRGIAAIAGAFLVLTVLLQISGPVGDDEDLAPEDAAVRPWGGLVLLLGAAFVPLALHLPALRAPWVPGFTIAILDAITGNAIGGLLMVILAVGFALRMVFGILTGSLLVLASALAGLGSLVTRSWRRA